ncbi:hypothetical protein [Nocardioides houyundeii]|uniref:hypothetical protein n=1 Tax=Nocardioides houyundeii TaxID=2045452 RepID=UPI000DF3CE86|nr:hypothetical protein [Nocardioides houyundeii]
MSKLPVPVEFRLPEGWEPVRPEEWGVDNAAFMAVRRDAPGDYVPILSISGDWRLDYITLETIADESVELARAQADEVELLDRKEIGSEEAPAILQLLGVNATIDGRGWELRQGQVLSGLVDVKDPSRRVVVIYTVTCAAEQFDVVGREFQAFMSTVKPVAPDGSNSSPESS